MILVPADGDRSWLDQFFSAPNEVVWSDIEAGCAPREAIEAVSSQLAMLAGDPGDTAIVLPFYRGGTVARWYATSATLEGEQRLRPTLRAWFGASYLSLLQTAISDDPQAIAMRRRFGRRVDIFYGPDHAQIADRIALLTRLEAQRPPVMLSGPRPVGRIRADLERALSARDEATALGLIDELRRSGRLNEENLQYVDVRFKAGLGQWEQIARAPWTIKNLADLPLPPQTLSDLIEALYRVYIDAIDPSGSPSTVLDAFRERIAEPFPKLFSSRHGVRTPRVVKAFILYERLQARPNPTILKALEALLPSEDATWSAAIGDIARPAEAEDPLVLPPQVPPEVVGADAGLMADADAEAAFEDCQYDRAFELFLLEPLTRKSLSRLLACAQFIATAEANARLISTFDTSGELKSGLPAQLSARIEALRVPSIGSDPSKNATQPSGWMEWARALAEGGNTEALESAAFENRTTWETDTLRQTPALCLEFSDLVANLTGPAADVARRAFPLMAAAFFPEREAPSAAVRPIAAVLILLIALDEAVAKADLDILSTALSVMLDLGLSSADYLTVVADLEAVQARVSSYANLPWALDVSEALALAPSPSSEAREARLRFFIGMLGQARGFAHRIAAHDFLAIEYLARDYGVDPAAVADLKPEDGPAPLGDDTPDLSGKTVGIYTLTEAAGARAKTVIQRLFAGCSVEVNSDTVCTSALTHLACTADIFIFVWRSSSHQAFFCVKEALGGRDPVYATGKGTASIVNAVLNAATKLAT